jgi:hypothetical protein
MSTNPANRKAETDRPNGRDETSLWDSNERAMTTIQRENRDWQGFAPTTKFANGHSQIAFAICDIRLLFA